MASSKKSSKRIFFNEIPVQDYTNYPFTFFSYVPQNSELNTILPVKVEEFLDFSLVGDTFSTGTCELFVCCWVFDLKPILDNVGLKLFILLIMYTLLF